MSLMGENFNSTQKSLQPLCLQPHFWLIRKRGTWVGLIWYCTEATRSFLLPGSLSLLITSHVYLGQKSCCTMDHGKLLNYLVDIFVPVCTSSIHSLYKLPVYSLEQIKQALDQALFCLYSHPSKKSSRARHLVDHNISQVSFAINLHGSGV